MSDRVTETALNPTHDASAGAPANLAVRQPSDEELDQRDRDKAGPRRAAGPPLREETAEASSRGVAPDEPPASTDPASEPMATGTPGGNQEAGSSETHASEAGRPLDHVGPKPSDDELDRRDRLKAGPRRAAGPPLRDEDPGRASRDAHVEALTPATDPEE